MNMLTDWIPEQLLYALGWTLVHSLWQLFAVGIILWMGLKLAHSKSSAFKYNLGIAALGASFLAVLITFGYEFSNFSPAPEMEIWLSDLALVQFSDGGSIATEDIVIQAVSWIDQQVPILVNFWFIGAILFLFRLFNSLTELRMLRKAPSMKVDFEVEKTFYRLVGKLGLNSNVSLKVTESGIAPMTFGYFKPVVLIPMALVFHLSPAQLEAIIAHELAHVKRNDYLINLIQSGLEVLFFYHPSYWWMTQTIKELRENAADDLAVDVGISPKELAYSLAEVLNFAQQNPPELALPASKKRNPTLQRIKRIMGQPTQTYPQNPIISIPMLLTLLFSAGLMASAQQDSPNAFEAIEPNVYLENPEIFGLESDYRFPSQLDTVKKETVIKKTVTKTDSPMVWTTDSGEKIIVKSNGTNSWTYRITGDTLIVDGDTLIAKGDQKFIFKDADGVDWASVPKMDFDFPEASVPPVFPEAPMPFFEMGEMPEMPPMAEMPEMPPLAEMPPMPEMPNFEFFSSELGPTVYRSDKNGVMVMRDTVNLSKAEKEKWAKEWEKQANEWAKRSEESMKEWEPQMKAWEEKMAAWHKANDPKMKEFEEKMKLWEKANEPKMKEFEEKMKAWEKANEPRMKEFEMQMEEWQKKFQPKMEEFQRKMEIWQEENAVKMEEFQRKLEEQFKKKDNSKN